MGLFFEDSKPPEPPPPQVIQQQAQWWPAVIIVTILTGIGMLLGWVLKPMLTYLFTFEGRTTNQIKTQILIIATLILGPLVATYTLSPTVRDLVTLSKTHTLNHSRSGGRIFFPAREYFTVEGERRPIPVGEKTYITYAGYTKNVMQKVESNSCPILPRSERLGLASIDQPEGAEGFEDKVNYTTVQSLSNLTGFSYLWELAQRPALWFNETDRLVMMIEVEKTASWKQFIDDWDLVWEFDSGHRAFEVKALSTEHAVICF